MNDEDKKKIKIAIIFLVISIILLLITKIMSYKGSYENQLKKTMTNVGATYYENVFFKSVKDKDTLKYFSEKGFIVDLDTAMYSVKYDTDKFVNNKTKEKCDLDNSYIYIYPKSPYGLKDYKIEVELSCGY